MHSKGMTNAQVQEVLEYGLKEWAPQLTAGNQDLNQERALAHMQTEVWKEPAEYKANMAKASAAYNTLPDNLKTAVNERIGNDPTFLQVMALFGAEMREDSPAAVESGITEQAEVEKLMMSEAYKDPKHPEHAKISAQVQNYFKAKNQKR